jgi:hypothetical protein
LDVEVKALALDCVKVVEMNNPASATALKIGLFDITPLIAMFDEQSNHTRDIGPELLPADE